MLSYEEWFDLINLTKDINTISRDRMRKSIFKGIPENLRGDIWCVLCHQ